jgi:HSP20 family molecular chaperone IbpA
VITQNAADRATSARNQVVVFCAFCRTPSRRAPKLLQGKIRADSPKEKDMTGKSQPGNGQSVQVVEADVLDRMNETNALIAQRAYEIFESRGGAHGSDRDDWFGAVDEILHPLAIERIETDGALRLTAQVPGFEAKDLEVAIGHRRAVICGAHDDSNQPADSRRWETKVMRIIELPFDVDPILAGATLESATLQIVLPRSR